MSDTFPIRLGGENFASKKRTGTADPIWYFYHNDHLGGVNVITDINGGRVQLIEYDPWGGVSRSEGSIDPDTRFTGQKLDAETGLYYYGGRYYDAEISRFISPDPFVPRPGNPQSLNRYSYTLNNPVRYIDPSGYFYISKDNPSFFQSIGGIIAGIVVGVITGGLGAPAIVAGAIGGATAGAINTAMNGGNAFLNVAGGALLGGVAGAIGGPIFSGLGGNTAAGFAASNFLPAVGAGAITGAITGALSTPIYGGNFGRNVWMGAATGAGMAAAVYGLGAAGERYYYGKDITSDLSVQQKYQEYKTRYTNAKVDGIRFFEGGAILPDGPGGLAADNGRYIVLREGLITGPSDHLAATLGHELFHIEQIRSIPNFNALWEAAKAQFGPRGNPYELLAGHRGAMFSGLPLSPIYNFHGLPQP